MAVGHQRTVVGSTGARLNDATRKLPMVNRWSVATFGAFAFDNPAAMSKQTSTANL
jgi:hypothetical protein